MATTLETLNLQIARLQEKRLVLLKREHDAEKRRDTRCKILIAAELFCLVGAGDERAVAVYRMCRGAVLADETRAQGNRELFDAWAGDPLPPTVTAPQQPSDDGDDGGGDVS